MKLPRVYEEKEMGRVLMTVIGLLWHSTALKFGEIRRNLPRSLR